MTFLLCVIAMTAFAVLGMFWVATMDWIADALPPSQREPIVGGLWTITAACAIGTSTSTYVFLLAAGK